MRAHPEDAAAKIDAALTAVGRTDLTPVKVERTPVVLNDVREVVQILVLPAGRTIMRAHECAVDRERFPQTIAEHIARDIVWDEENREELEARHRSILEDYATFLGMLPETPLLVSSTGNGSSNIQFDIYGIALTEALAPRMQLFNGLASLFEGQQASKALALAASQRARLAELAPHADRKAALTCCPVAARAIVADPARWSTTLRNALDDRAGALSGFWTGRYQPEVILAPDLHWKHGFLRINQKLPETLKLALIGRHIRDVVEHPFLDPDCEIVGVTERRNGMIYLRIDAQAVPLGPVLDAIGMNL